MPQLLHQSYAYEHEQCCPCFRKVHGGGGDSSTIEESAIVFEKSCRQGYKEDFCDGVEECTKKYQKPYHKLKPNERCCHITHLSEEILDACVDTS